MIKQFKNKWFKINFVLRHRWERGDFSNYEKFKMKNEFRLGLWIKTYKAVGNAKGPLKFVFSDGNHVRGYMLGFDLIVCKMWMDISKPVLELSIN